MSKKKSAPNVDGDLSLVNWDPKTNRVTCTSMDVADHFGKRHGYVLAAIERHIEEDLKDRGDVQKSLEISAVVDGRKVQRSLHLSHPDFAPFQGETANKQAVEMYAMTREGFMDIAVNFTGEDARRWKRRLRKAFSHYEKIALQATAHKSNPDRIAARLEGIEVRKEAASKMVDLRDAIEEKQGEKSQCAAKTLCNLTKMAQKALFDRVLPKEAKLREWLTKPQLDNLKAVEKMLSVYLPQLTAKVVSGDMDYHQPYHLAKDRTETMVMFLGGKTEVPDFVPRALEAEQTLDFGEAEGRLAA